MSEHVERIAVLEVEVEKLQNSQKEILECIHSVRDEMMRYKGFLGGVAFLRLSWWSSFLSFWYWYILNSLQRLDSKTLLRIYEITFRR